MRIVQATSELHPFASTGNLGINVNNLISELGSSKEEISIFMPGYREALLNSNLPPTKHVFELLIELGDNFELCEILKTNLTENITLYFICRDEYFDRQFQYGPENRDYDDNDARFIFFSKAVVETIRRFDLKVDLIHCHDWPTALIPIFVRYSEERHGICLADTILTTIHTIKYQGIFPAKSFKLTNLPDDFFSIDALEYYDQINFLKAGIIFSNYISTDSLERRDRLLTIENGCGLDGVLSSHKEFFLGENNWAELYNNILQ